MSATGQHQTVVVWRLSGCSVQCAVCSVQCAVYTCQEEAQGPLYVMMEFEV